MAPDPTATDPTATMPITADTDPRTPPAAADPAAPRRLTGLDGLRGLAALIVVFWHAMLTTKNEAVWRRQPWHTDPFSQEWWIFDTPLRLLTMGNQAVAVFFVLSGVVLALPLLRGRFDAWDYYPRRFVRLWLPTAVSMLLAMVMIKIAGSDIGGTDSGWVRRYNEAGISIREALHSFLLITGDPKLNNPVWSLRWEMLFSLLLPIFFVLALALRRRPWITIGMCTLLSAIGSHWHVGALKYLPLFLAGAVAAHLVTNKDAAQPSRRTARCWLGGGIMLIALGDIARTFLGNGESGDNPYRFLFGTTVIGSVLVILAIVHNPGTGRFFDSPPLQFLGRISFSLYLVHVPIILTTLHIVGADDPLWALAFSIPLSIGVGWSFMRVIEMPSHHLSKRIGKQTAGLAHQTMGAKS